MEKMMFADLRWFFVFILASGLFGFLAWFTQWDQAGRSPEVEKPQKVLLALALSTLFLGLCGMLAAFAPWGENYQFPVDEAIRNVGILAGMTLYVILLFAETKDIRASTQHDSSR